MPKDQFGQTKLRTNGEDTSLPTEKLEVSKGAEGVRVNASIWDSPQMKELAAKMGMPLEGDDGEEVAVAVEETPAPEKSIDSELDSLLEDNDAYRTTAMEAEPAPVEASEPKQQFKVVNAANEQLAAHMEPTRVRRTYEQPTSTPDSGASSCIDSACGADLPAGAKFCKVCGKNQQQSLFCTECGHRFSGREKFCPECSHPR